MSLPVVVVGGGVGGLAAAVSLLMAGRRVLLFEQQPKAGGYVTSFLRQGYSFDPALHAVPAGGPDGYFTEVLRDLGIADRVSLLKPLNGFSVVLGDRHFVLPNEPDELFAYLSERFPAERPGLRDFRADVNRWAPLYYDVVEGRLSNWQIATRFVPRVPLFLRHAELPVARYLDRYIGDPLLRALLLQPAIFSGHTTDMFPTISYLLMFYLLACRGVYTIRGGGQALTDALVTRVKQLGGEIRCRSRVTSIGTRNGRARSVCTADGTQIAAAAVVCNVNAPAVRALLGDGVNRTWARAQSRLSHSLSVAQLHVGLDCTLETLGIAHYLSTVFPTHDLDSCIRRQTAATSLESYSLTARGVVDPALDPPGKAVLSVVGAVNPAPWFAAGENEYRQLKQVCIDECLDRLEALYPGVRAHAQVIDLATPRTFHRYTGNPHGAIMGYAGTIGSHRPLRVVSKQLPAQGVYLASAWTLRFGGMMQAMRAGVAAGRRLAREIPA